jgi:hypothetical protein
MGGKKVEEIEKTRLWTTPADFMDQFRPVFCRNVIKLKSRYISGKYYCQKRYLCKNSVETVP